MSIKTIRNTAGNNNCIKPQFSQRDNLYYCRLWFDLGMKGLDEGSRILNLIRNTDAAAGRDLIRAVQRKDNIALYCLRRSRKSLEN